MTTAYELAEQLFPEWFQPKDGGTWAIWIAPSDETVLWCKSANAPGATFKDACIEAFSRDADDIKFFNPEKLAYWGCSIYPNKYLAEHASMLYQLARRDYAIIKVGSIPSWMIRTNIIDIKYHETYAIDYDEESDPHCPLPECSCKGEHDHNYS